MIYDRVIIMTKFPDEAKVVQYLLEYRYRISSVGIDRVHFKFVVAMELPSVDDRVYKTILLPNDLQVLLISDPTTDKAAAALDVRVGQLCDGSMEGLAHFCEHMLYVVQLSVQMMMCIARATKYGLHDVYCTSYENMGCTSAKNSLLWLLPFTDLLGLKSKKIQRFECASIHPFGADIQRFCVGFLGFQMRMSTIVI
jgi:hypothetical protein